MCAILCRLEDTEKGGKVYCWSCGKSPGNGEIQWKDTPVGCTWRTGLRTPACCPALLMDEAAKVIQPAGCSRAQ